MLAILLSTVAVFLLTLLFVISWQKYQYWSSRNVKTPFFLPLFGNILNVVLSSPWIYAENNYNKFKNFRFWGQYEGFNPILFISDQNLLRDVLVKEADHFIDRRNVDLSNQKEFSEMLGFQTGEKWKALRSILSPTFTSGKMKAMFPIINSLCDELNTQCQLEMDKNKFVEMRSLFTYYSMDVIAECAFGINAQCQIEKEESLFDKHGKKLADFSGLNSIKFLIGIAFPQLMKFFKVKLFNNVDFFVNAINQTIKQRETSDAKRGDFLDLLLEAKKKAQNDDIFKYPITNDTIISSSVLFLFAGFDTTSNALSFATHLLALNPEYQERLREELLNIVETDGELNYNNVMEAEYLDAVLSETLRLYPLGHTLERICTKNYKIPDSDLELPEGMIIMIAVFAIHRDPDLWNDPETFLPDRFLPQNKANIKPFSYMPFGLGPRNCIGLRFAQMTAKLALAKLCLEFSISIKKGHEKILLDKSSIVTALRPKQNYGVQVLLNKIK